MFVDGNRQAVLAPSGAHAENAHFGPMKHDRVRFRLRVKNRSQRLALAFAATDGFRITARRHTIHRRLFVPVRGPAEICRRHRFGKAQPGDMQNHLFSRSGAGSQFCCLHKQTAFRSLMEFVRGFAVGGTNIVSAGEVPRQFGAHRGAATRRFGRRGKGKPTTALSPFVLELNQRRSNLRPTCTRHASANWRR